MSSSVVEDLAGVLGHELRNPLAGAVTAVSLLREMVDADDPRSAIVDQAMRDLERVSRLTDGWLKMARTGRVQRCRIDVDDLVRRVAERNGATIVGNAVETVVDGNTDLIERALDNLIGNAMEAGATNIRVAAQVLGSEVSIHVEDDAGGIPEADRSRVFTPGWSGRGGHGLGLHAVSATVRAHGGRIRCVPVRNGTRFTVTLPASRLQTAMA